MPKLVKDGSLIDDEWTLVGKGEPLPESGQLIVNVADWQENAESLTAKGAGLWLDADQAPSEIPVAVDTLPVIAINFPAFADGRGYSYAYILKTELQYSGELRAVGEVLRDQLFYMQRVGFNAFAVDPKQDADSAKDSLQDFTTVYQASADDATPLFAKRW